MRKFREWRLRRKYKAIYALERKLRYSPATRVLRARFAQDSVKVIDGALKMQGYSRGVRRRAKREVVKAR